MAAKRERKRERARDRRERMQMGMWFSLATTAITAFGGNVNPSILQAAQQHMEASDDNSSLSSYSSSDSGPTKRLKLSHGKQRTAEK